MEGDGEPSEVLIRRTPGSRALGWLLYLFVLPLVACVAFAGASLAAFLLTRTPPTWLILGLGVAGTAWLGRAAFRELQSRDYSELVLAGDQLVVTRGSRTWTWALAELQEFRLGQEGLRLRGPDGARLLLHELAPEAIHRLREAVVPAMAGTLARRLDAGETIEVRQPLAPLFGVLVLLLVMAGLVWLLCATIFRAPWLGWVLVGLTSPFALNVLSQFRTGGLAIRAHGIRAPRSDRVVPWAEVTRIAADTASIMVVTPHATFTLAGAGSPEPLAQAMIERVERPSQALAPGS